MDNLFDLSNSTVLATSTEKLYLGVWALDNTDTYQLIDEIDEIESLLTVYKYVKVSTCTLTVPYTPKVSQCLNVRNMLTIHSPQTLGVENTECFIITNKQLSETNGTVTLQISGKNPLFWLQKRRALTTNDGYSNTSAEVIAKDYVLNNCSTGATSERQYANLTVQPIQRFGDNITFVNTQQYPTIFDICQTVLNSQNLGQNITFNLITKQFQYNVIQGVDRSQNQTTNPPVVFTPELNNLQSQSYTHSINNFANVVYVYAQIDSINEVSVIGSGTGFDRYETATSGTLNSGSDVKLTLDNYEDVFELIGENTLITQAETKNVIGTVKLDSDCQLNINFNIGDTVTYSNLEWGVSENVMINELRLQYSSDGFIAQASLGYPLPTLEDKLGVTLS